MIETHHKPISYFAMFLWIHIYLSVCLMVYTYSMHIFVIQPFFVIGVAQDLYMLSM